MIDILVIGLILVGLMVYLSTRVKRTAAEAYAREEIAGPHFAMIKPAGFLSVASPEDGLIFRGYSREFAAGDATSFRKSEIFVDILQGTTVPAAAAAVRAEATHLISEETPADGEESCILTVEDNEFDVRLVQTFKLVASGNDVLRLRIDTPGEAAAEMGDDIKTVVDSFRTARQLDIQL